MKYAQRMGKRNTSSCVQSPRHRRSPGQYRRPFLAAARVFPKRRKRARQRYRALQPRGLPYDDSGIGHRLSATVVLARRHASGSHLAPVTATPARTAGGAALSGPVVRGPPYNDSGIGPDVRHRRNFSTSSQREGVMLDTK